MPPMSAEQEQQASGAMKVSVLGAGSLGKEHVRIYAKLAAARRVEFVGIDDRVADNAQRLAQG
jgi:hypothetical protein